MAKPLVLSVPAPPAGPAPGTGRAWGSHVGDGSRIQAALPSSVHEASADAQLREPEEATPIPTRTIRLCQYDGEDAVAWAWFCDLDKDQSGSLDKEEMWPLVKKVGLKLSRRDFEKRFGDLDPSGSGLVDFKTFAAWWKLMKETERREHRRSVKDAFEAVDSDKSGKLTKEEFGKLNHKARKLMQLDPPFDLEKDWGECRTQKFADLEPQLTYPDFEAWWKTRLGIEDPDIPVLPEFMVSQVEEETRLLKKRQRIETASSMDTPRSRARRGEKRKGPELWALLRPRVLSIVRMQRQCK